ncbi:MAG: hypothetical protein ACLPKE_19575 [Streptosporangiaceae bacterium]
MREAELRHLVDVRTHQPRAVAEAAARRRPARSLLGGHGRLAPEAMIRAIAVAAVDAVVEML